MGCDDNNVWYFGGPGDEWYVSVYDIDWWGLGFSIDIPSNWMTILTNR